ncbi:MAG: MBL fold metallo-hydrolase [Bacteroidales bacterium]|nr:MBL fold metallo-hydrolase [Bacteroidales bacterium]
MRTFIFLGTGTSQGVPIIGCDCAVCRSNDKRDHRLRTSGLIKSDNTQIVIDAGPDFRFQMLRERIKGNIIDRLDGIVLTHFHHDHIGGLDDVRPYLHIMQKPVALYGNSDTLHHIQDETFRYAFSENPYPGAPQFATHIVKDEPFVIGDIMLQPVDVLHKENFPILGYRIDDFVYLTDVKFISSDSLEKIRGAHTLVINALRGWQHPSHLSLPEALTIIEQVKPKQAYLTHISHRLGLYDDVVKQLPENVLPAYDGLEITV